MKRTLCLLLTLCAVLLLLPSCGGTDAEPTTAVTTVDNRTVYNNVYFIIGDNMIRVPTRENEMPVPPEGYDAPLLSIDKIGTFTGWDQPLVAPTAENMAGVKQKVYKAQYSYQTRTYSVKFRIGETEYPLTLEANQTPECPVTPTAPAGMIFAGWDKEVVAVKEDAVYNATFMSSDCPSTFTVATWNVGHFAMGNARDTKIGDPEYEAKSAQYREYLSDLGADIICLNEYSRQFTASHTAEEALFAERPPIYFAGEQRHFSCNAVYAGLPLQNITVHDYACNQGVKLLYSDTNKAEYYYYITAELVVGTETVHFVFTHLAFDDDNYDLYDTDAVAANQIAELIDLYKDVDHVVMMGDWNAYRKHLFDPFADAGYTLGNYYTTNTCLGTVEEGGQKIQKLKWPIDDIIVKGLSMTDFHAVDTGLSDHIAVVATLTLTNP